MAGLVCTSTLLITWVYASALSSLLGISDALRIFSVLWSLKGVIFSMLLLLSTDVKTRSLGELETLLMNFFRFLCTLSSLELLDWRSCRCEEPFEEVVGMLFLSTFLPP